MICPPHLGVDAFCFVCPRLTGLQGKYITLETSREFALEKVEEYKAWNDRYQRWKQELKNDVSAWAASQKKKFIGST